MKNIYSILTLLLLLVGPSCRSLYGQEEVSLFYLRIDSARTFLDTDPVKSAAIAQRASAIASRDEQRLEAAELRAHALEHAGENVIALSAFEMAEGLSLRLHDAQARGRLLNGLGSVYRSMGRYDQSLTLHLKALSVFDSLGNDLGRAQTMHDLAETLFALGQLQEARQNIDRSLRLRLEQDNKRGIAQSYSSLGRLYMQSGDMDSARISYTRALAELKSIGLHSAPVAENFSRLGDVYLRMGDIREALDSYNQALSIAEAVGSSNLAAEIKTHLGRGYRMIGDLKRAREALASAVKLADAGAVGSVLAEALDEASQVEKLSGNDDAAFRLLRRSVAIRDSMFSLLDRERLVEAENLYRKERSGMEFRDFEESREQDLLLFLLVVAVLLLILAGIALYLSRVKAQGSREMEAKSKEIRDMNARLQTLNKELAQSEEKYRMLFERLPVGVFLYDNSLQLIQVNQAFVDIVGSTRERLEGFQMTELNDDRIVPALRNAIEGELGAYEGEYTTTTSQVLIDISMRTAPLTWSGSKARYGIGFMLDVTNWKRIERDLIEAKEMAEMADGMKHAFLTSISHEIRTPLNVIMGYFGILKGDLRDRLSADEIDHFNKVDLAVRRLLRTVDQILNLSILESGTYAVSREACSVLDMIMELVEEVRPLAEDKGLKVDLIPSCADVTVHVDRYSIAQALRNLLDNAVKFTDEGTIRISLECRHSALSVIIEDSGIGMSEEYIQRLYQSFSQEEGGYTRAYDGLGLGLTLTKRYVDVNDGSILVKSRKGLGTTFTVHLPVVSEEERESAPIPIIDPEPAREGKVHVLVVEDDMETQKFLQLILKPLYMLSFADDAMAAWSVLESEDIDIILMDISLRGDEDGLQLTRRIRQNPAYSALPIIAVTAHAFADDRRRSLEAGCTDYLPKPFRMKQLREVITQYTS
ncbi:tetratricopeptide repeat protein [bacterium]|nr:tetratricopeptide repeat protein [bacterium]